MADANYHRSLCQVSFHSLGQPVPHRKCLWANSPDSEVSFVKGNSDYAAIAGGLLLPIFVSGSCSSQGAECTHIEHAYSTCVSPSPCRSSHQWILSCLKCYQAPHWHLNINIEIFWESLLHFLDLGFLPLNCKWIQIADFQVNFEF